MAHKLVIYVNTRKYILHIEYTLTSYIAYIVLLFIECWLMITLFNDRLPIPNPFPLHLLQRSQKLLPLLKRHKPVPFGFLRFPVPDDDGFGAGGIRVLEGGEEEGVGDFGA